MNEKRLLIPDLVDVRPNFFHPSRVLFDLDDIIPQEGNRKVEFNLGQLETLPKILSEAVKFACDETHTKYTTAILKDYWPGKPSAAYHRHTDPIRFINGPLFLCTLRGEANFSIWDNVGVEYTYEAIPNLVMLVNPMLEHQVSKPKGLGYRSLLFLGVEE